MFYLRRGLGIGNTYRRLYLSSLRSNRLYLNTINVKRRKVCVLPFSPLHSIIKIGDENILVSTLSTEKRE